MTSSKPSRVAKKIYSVVLMVVSLLPFLIMIIVPFGVTSESGDIQHLDWIINWDFNFIANFILENFFRIGFNGTYFTLNLADYFSVGNSILFHLDICLCWFIFFQFVDILLDFILFLPRFIHSFFERWSN